MTPEERRSFLQQFDLTASVEHDGLRYQLGEDDLIPGPHPGDPGSTWYRCSLIGRARQRFSPPLDRETVLSLVAGVLRSTVADLESAMDWNANYMAWHDGGEVHENHVWPKEEAPNPGVGNRKSDS